MQLGFALLVVKILAAVLVFDPLGEDAFALPKSALGRAITYPLLAVTAVAFLQGRGALPRALVWSGLAYIVVVAAATVFAVHPYTALFGAPRRFMGLTQVLDGAALATAAAVFLRDVARLRIFALAISGGMAAAAAYAIGQAAGIDPVIYTERSIGSTIGNAGALAGFALIAGAILAASVMTGLLRARRERVALAAAVILSVFVIMLTGARGPLLAIAVTAIALALVAAQHWPDRIPQVRRSAIAGGAAVGTALFVLALLSTPAGVRLTALATGGDLSTTERGLIYGATLEATLKRPVLGVGMDGLAVVYPSVRPEQISSVSGAQQTQTSAHSWFLHQLLGAGVLGMVSASALVIVAFIIGWPRTRSGDPAAALGIAALVAFLAQGAFNIVHVVTDATFWLSIGLIAASAMPSGPSRRSSSAAPAIFAVVLILTSVGLWSAWRDLDANRAVRTSNALRAVNELVRAERAALRATDIDPARADHWNVLGLSRRDRPEAALGAYERAVEAAPYDPVYWLNLARTEALLGQASASIRARSNDHARLAVELDPNGPATLARAGEILLFNGDSRGALEFAQRLIRVLPGTTDGVQLASKAYEAMGDATKAAAALETVLGGKGPVRGASLADRLRLAGLYARAGEPERARTLVSAPVAAAVDVSCVATSGSVEGPGGSPRPRCLRIIFTREAPLLAEGTTGSTVDARSYLLNGLPLPTGSTVTYDGNRFVVIQLPGSTAPPVPGAEVTVRSVRDIYGNLINPDPTTLAVP